MILFNVRYESYATCICFKEIGTNTIVLDDFSLLVRREFVTKELERKQEGCRNAIAGGRAGKNEKSCGYHTPQRNKAEGQRRLSGIRYHTQCGQKA